MRAALLTLAVTAFACSAPTRDVPAKPSSVSYELAFPNVASAVAVDSVQLFVFDATTADGSCLSVLANVSALPPAPLLLNASEPLSPCDVGKDESPSAGAVPAVSYGARSLLAVARRAQATLFVGCVTLTLSASSEQVQIQLTPKDVTVSVPPTSCSSLDAKCSGGCS